MLSAACRCSADRAAPTGLHSADGRPSTARRGRGGGVAAVELAGQAVGDGGLAGQDRGQGVGLFAGAGHADQGDHFGVRQRPADQQIEGPGVLAVQVGGQRHEQMAAAEHLPPGQLPVRPRASRRASAGRSSSVSCGGGPTSLAARVDGGGQAVDRPADRRQLVPPAGHQLGLDAVSLWPAGGPGGHRPGLVGVLAAPCAFGVDLAPPASSAPPSPRRERRRCASAAASPTGPDRPRWRSPTRPPPGPPPPGRPWWRRADAPATRRCRPPSSRPCSSSISTRLANST